MTAPGMLPGSHRDSRPLRQCDKCKADEAPMAGVQVGPKWLCRQCYKSRQERLKP